ncbi:hypothetical protein CALVIDRAFT_536132 [Calocera viscosa TUFC12733]|uniref:Mug135-like C-terminal domain-containing protein n=1 Tax=Calocera viscosa (strain TUFC12733) TaxID=1330018 RepID=A0A167NBR3_CALVF|nr:hypothetical protein CALVIDRAFT_536132 [Calocera viscosa TUFC12733]
MDEDVLTRLLEHPRLQQALKTAMREAVSEELAPIKKSLADLTDAAIVTNKMWNCGSLDGSVRRFRVVLTPDHVPPVNSVGNAVVIHRMSDLDTLSPQDLAAVYKGYYGNEVLPPHLAVDRKRRILEAIGCNPAAIP